MLSNDQILKALSNVYDPELHRSLTELKMVRDVRLCGDAVDVTVALTVPNCPMKDRIETDLRAALGTLPEIRQIAIHWTAMTEEERTALFGEPADGMALPYNRVKCVVAVMSGKGGVGKSLVTGLLAVAMEREGYQVGVLDADITGPSIPMLFGLHGPVEPGPVGIRPLHSRTGIRVMSMNLLLEEEDRPVIWRGPLVGKAITQLWGDVMWGDLDYLLVDLPPGTSDAALTTMQSLPVKGIVMVTTPQRLASMVVRKAVHMAQAAKTPVIGVVENMAYFVCPDSGKRHTIFGPSHAEEVAIAANAPLLAQLPIDPQAAALCDAGKIEDVNFKEMPGLFDAFAEAADLVGSYRAGLQYFSEKALQLIKRRENLGAFESPDARAQIRGRCGDMMQIDLQILAGRIKEARFITDGCGATVACGSMITRLARSKTLSQAQQITPDDLVSALDGLPEDHLHCAELAVDTLRQAIENAGGRKG